jgi:hypothetical protein
MHPKLDPIILKAGVTPDELAKLRAADASAEVIQGRALKQAVL